MEYLLEVKDLCKTYNTFSLKNVSIKVPKGSIVGFVGENGAGKTTTLKAVIGALEPEQGEIYLFGQPMSPKQAEVKQDIGIVMEGSFFYEDFTPNQIAKVLRGVYKNWNQTKYSAYIEKYRLPVDKKIKEFSKGMLMKLSLVIALSHEAKLLILDEPTSGLDPIVRNEILDELLDFIQDEEHGVLFSSHITSDLEKIADYITFIHHGEVILTEQKDELLETYGLLKCGASEFNQLDRSDFIGFKKGQFQVEALTKDKLKLQEKYPEFIIDEVSIEEIMLFYVKGMGK